jgi:hypothetical protein
MAALTHDSIDIAIRLPEVCSASNEASMAGRRAFGRMPLSVLLPPF